MIYEKDNKKELANNDSDYSENFNTVDECEEKIEKLNKKLQATADELEEISALYAKSVKDGLDKAKKIKELEDRIAELEDQLKKCQQNNKKTDEAENKLKECQKEREELEKQLKECQEEKKKLEEKVKELEIQLKECQEEKKKLEEKVKELEIQLKECQKEREQLENRLKECQDKNKTLDAKQSQWIVGEYKWMRPGSTMPDGWVKVKIDKGFTLVENDQDGQTKGTVGHHTHKFSDNYGLWASKEPIYFINDRSGGAIGRKYMPFVNNFNSMTALKETGNWGNNTSESNQAAGKHAELWVYEGTRKVEKTNAKVIENANEAIEGKTE